MTVYLDLTREFNEGALRAVLSSGQAVVLHRLWPTAQRAIEGRRLPEAHRVLVTRAVGVPPLRPSAASEGE